MIGQLRMTTDGRVADKVEFGIMRLRAFEPPEGYFLAYSGGKDSQAALKLARMAGVKFDVHYSVTGLDAKEVVRYIISQFDTIIYMVNEKPDRMYSTHGPRLLNRTDHAEGEIIYWHLPETPMYKLIAEKKMPPTRRVRYCCQELKEMHGTGRSTVTGVRCAESTNRKLNQGVITIPGAGKKAQKALCKMGVNFTKTNRGGVVLNYDNDPDRRITEFCIRTGKVIINPIADWTLEDVWEFLGEDQHCCLYEEGFERLGCLVCPMGRREKRLKELERWPHMRNFYLKAFERMLEERRKSGLPCNNWNTPEDVMEWWLEDAKEAPEQDSESDFQMTLY